MQYNIYFIVKETNRVVLFAFLWYNFFMIKKILRENIYYILLIIFTIIFFVFIKNGTYNNNIIDFDNKVIEWFKIMRVGFFTSLFKVLTNFGDWYIPIPLIVCIFLLFKNKWYFYILACSYAFSGVLSFFTKILISRPRPLEAIIEIPKSYSFPSGHTLTSIVFYVTLCYMLTINIKSKARGILLFLTLLLIILIALSRVYLGVHFFSDVVGGAILGILCELMIINIIKKNFRIKLL